MVSSPSISVPLASSSSPRSADTREIFDRGWTGRLVPEHLRGPSRIPEHHGVLFLDELIAMADTDEVDRLRLRLLRAIRDLGV